MERRNSDSEVAYQGGEVSEDRQRRVGDANVGQCQEKYTGEEGVDRDTSLVDPLEDLGRLPLNRKLEQGSGTNVNIRVGCRKDEKQNAAVDEGGQELDTGESNGDDEGTGRGVCSTTEGPFSSGSTRLSLRSALTSCWPRPRQ